MTTLQATKNADEGPTIATAPLGHPFTAEELKNINPAKQAAVIARPVGRRKRNIIIAEANKLKITILNPRRGEI